MRSAPVKRSVGTSTEVRTSGCWVVEIQKSKIRPPSFADLKLMYRMLDFSFTSSPDGLRAAGVAPITLQSRFLAWEGMCRRECGETNPGKKSRGQVGEYSPGAADFLVRTCAA